MNYPRKVYAIRHNVTNRVYIGSSCHVDKRFNEHINALRAHRHRVEDMQVDFDKYGEDFTLTVLDHIATAEDRGREYDWMKKNQSYIRGVGYNYNDRKWLSMDKQDEEQDEICEEIQPLEDFRNDNEKELINMIRGHENPAKAMVIAAAVISTYLCMMNKPIVTN